MTGKLLEVRGLKKYFPITGGILGRTVGQVRAVDGLDFFVRPGETLGLVGESGCGKTTVARLLLRLLTPTAGEVIYKGQNIVHLRGRALQHLRRELQIIFQDPYGSLNPRLTVAEIIGEQLSIHGLARDRQERLAMVRELLAAVGLEGHHLWRYPHEFSGGQRQRIGIARALALNPQLVVTDEPVSALDVSIQAQIVNLLLDLQERYKLAYVFVSHDLSIVRYMSHRVAVMYLGKIVESAPVAVLFERPAHPYTQALLSAVPLPDPAVRRQRIVLEGDLPSPANLPRGCRFHPRCFIRLPRCREEEPHLHDCGGGHLAACHIVGGQKSEVGAPENGSRTESLQGRAPDVEGADINPRGTGVFRG
ncbi:MAG: Oligopeptide transport ATP-binding protein OppF [Syntrophomonadaceae bacterium]|nr:Oligopeptide transport ATP-binding protein OppF [Bacillota bacterium]